MTPIFKKLLPILIFYAAADLHAQSPFPTIDSVNINNINAAVLVHGDMWWNPTTQLAHCSFPNGSLKNINTTSGIWMSGYDQTGQLHVSAQTYRQDGNDYWPGPLDENDTLTYATSQSWAKIWKVNRTDIQYFLSLSVHDTINTPQAILTWPATGNAYARGNVNAPLTMYPLHTYAPFVDLNGNGIYEPLLGEYPDVPGDQALWWIFSDNGPTHTQSNGRPLGVEVQAMAYAYNRGSLIDNVIYYRYHVINYSGYAYHNFRFGQFANPQLGGAVGYFSTNFIGFDSVYRMGIAYTAYTAPSGGNPTNYNGYELPVIANTMIVLPGDSGTTYVPAGSFNYFNNDSSGQGYPIVDTQYNNYLRSENKIGRHITYDYSSPGIQSTGYGPGPNTNYVFTSDPDSAGWSECSCNNNPGDRHIILASNDFTVLPGSRSDIVFALITTNLDSLNGCPDVSFAGIKIVADTAWAIYHNPLPPIPASVPNILAPNTLSIYPNPANDRLYITSAVKQNGRISIAIYNTLGQLMNVNATTNNKEQQLDICLLLPGTYYILYKNGNEQKTAKFIKEGL